MCGEHQSLVASVPEQQGGGQMDGVQRSERRWEWIRCTPEDSRGHISEVGMPQKFERKIPTFRKSLEIELTQLMAAVQRSQALHFGQCAGYHLLNRKPLGKSARLGKDDP